MSEIIKFEILAPRLIEIEKEIIDKSYLKFLLKNNSSIKWGGAGVIITSEAFDEHTNDYVLITENANEIAWYFDRVKHVLYEANVMDYLSKYSLFKKLAIAANSSINLASSENYLLAIHQELKNIIVAWDIENSS